MFQKGEKCRFLFPCFYHPRKVLQLIIMRFACKSGVKFTHYTTLNSLFTHGELLRRLSSTKSTLLDSDGIRRKISPKMYLHYQKQFIYAYHYVHFLKITSTRFFQHLVYLCLLSFDLDWFLVFSRHPTKNCTDLLRHVKGSLQHEPT